MRMTNTNSTSVKPALHLHWLWLGLGLAGLQGLIACCFILLPIRVSFPLEDKLWHLAAFALPAWWFFQLYSAAFERRALLAVFTGLAILGEVLQQLTPYHTVESSDALANLAGVLLGLGLAEQRGGQFLRALDQASMRVLRNCSGSHM